MQHRHLKRSIDKALGSITILYYDNMELKLVHIDGSKNILSDALTLGMYVKTYYASYVAFVITVYTLIAVEKLANTAVMLVRYGVKPSSPEPVLYILLKSRIGPCSSDRGHYISVRSRPVHTKTASIHH